MVHAHAFRIRVGGAFGEPKKRKLVGGVLANAKEGRAATATVQGEADNLAVEGDGAVQVPHVECDVAELPRNSLHWQSRSSRRLSTLR